MTIRLDYSTTVALKVKTQHFRKDNNISHYGKGGPTFLFVIEQYNFVVFSEMVF